MPICYVFLPIGEGEVAPPAFAPMALARGRVELRVPVLVPTVAPAVLLKSLRLLSY